MSTITLHVRVSKPVHDFMTAESERTGLPIAQIADAFLRKAMQEGWQVDGVTVGRR